MNYVYLVGGKVFDSFESAARWVASQTPVEVTPGETEDAPVLVTFSDKKVFMSQRQARLIEKYGPFVHFQIDMRPVETYEEEED